ncbi:MAG: hypothetical protein CR991_03505 [Proteobacteria bacterium]|nr:MAG: hypothetical protein CR991_03505 [Pseudomonadota bacterium]
MGGVVLSLGAMLEPNPSEISNLNNSALPIFLGLGVLSTAVPSLDFALVSKRLPAIITAMISLFVPIFSGIFAFLMLGEHISVIFLAGCALVLLR